MTSDPIEVRPAGVGDRDALAEFSCSNGAWFEDDVQRYVRTRAYDDTKSGYLYTLLVVEQAGQLIGCAGWRPVVLYHDDDENFITTRLQVLALALTHQGYVTPSGARLSDELLAITLSQALAPAGQGVITALVAAENVRSIKLCERNGLTSQTRYDTHHVMLTGAFGADPTWHARL